MYAQAIILEYTNCKQARINLMTKKVRNFSTIIVFMPYPSYSENKLQILPTEGICASLYHQS